MLLGGPCIPGRFGRRKSHKFAARYDFGAPTLARAAAPIVDSISDQIEASKPRTYVHDICTRCGHVVQRPKS